jgi:ribosome-binding ATPase YchF (GTP1/OBG family)
MIIGIIGGPNKGKSTLFSAITTIDVNIANYPFTTIKPNLGVGYASKQCVEKELGVKCTPRNSLCKDGTRLIPVNVIDVAGLVPGAHMGKGMGNQFLNDLMAADVLLQVVDASCKTDANGNNVEYSDPAEEILMVRDEISRWLAGILMRQMQKISKRSDGVSALCDVLSSFGIKKEQIEKSLQKASLVSSSINWGEDDAMAFASEVLKESKPMLVVANKIDRAKEGVLDDIAKKIGNVNVIGCSAAIELALRKAENAKDIEYAPGSRSLKVIGEVSAEKANALKYMSGFLEKSGTGVQEAINYAVFGIMQKLTIYPVEDENKYTDHSGKILPDVFLIDKGSKAVSLAEKIHSSIAKNMLYAIDAKRKMRVAKDYELRDDDVIKIVSSAKS